MWIHGYARRKMKCTSYVDTTCATHVPSCIDSTCVYWLV
jgi:hypothetical protein